MGPKIPYLGIFWLQFNKSYYQIFTQHPQIFDNIKFHPKQKNYSWDQKGFIWVFWETKLKNYCHIWNQHHPICLIAKFGAKNKNPFIWDQRCQICVFWDRIWTYYCHTWNWHPWICLIHKLREIMKMLKFGTKNSLFGFFLGGPEFSKKVFSYLKSAPSNLSNCKQKCQNFGQKIALFWYFEGEIWKNCCHIWN